MKYFALPLCVLSFVVVTRGSPLLRRGGDETHSDRELFLSEERALFNIETQVASTNFDDKADECLENIKKGLGCDAYDTAMIYQACQDLRPPGQRNAGNLFERSSRPLRSFCKKMGQGIGGLCFDDEDCGSDYCSNLSEGPKESITVSRGEPIPGWFPWFLFPTPRNYGNVFVCHNPIDRSDTLNIGRKPPCGGSCQECFSEDYSCEVDLDCISGSKCVEIDDLGIKFCGGPDGHAPEGGCCVTGLDCPNGGFCDMSPGKGSAMTPNFPASWGAALTSVGRCV
mmetsp:Transcript_7278/g.10679  ORF Transcript_7278/g.10679 Transcript_7278/m.10679 type:complete len:283 (-) Transcript_7278:203-1051(-)